MDFEFENEMNNIFGDDLTVVPHFTLNSLNKKRSIDVIDLVGNDKKNTSDIEVEIKKKTNQLEKKPKSKKLKSNTITAINIGNNMMEILLRQEEKRDEYTK